MKHLDEEVMLEIQKSLYYKIKSSDVTDISLINSVSHEELMKCLSDSNTLHINSPEFLRQT